MKTGSGGWIIPVLLSALIGLYILVYNNLAVKRESFLQQTYMDYTLPSGISGPVALEFKGIVSDFLFLKVSTFLGQKFMKKEKLNLKHGDYIYNSVDAITNLDPWFWDAYLFANMLLSWDFRQIDRANKLLLKARQYRTTDYQVPYHIGFNYFYFLKDNLNGAKYIMEASRLPESPSYLPGLATRLSASQNQYRPAILYLEDIIKRNRNPALLKQFETRLKLLVILNELNIKTTEYKKKYGVFPIGIDSLLQKGMIGEVPEDPYGGKFVIQENGHVITTSKMVYGKSKS